MTHGVVVVRRRCDLDRLVVRPRDDDDDDDSGGDVVVVIVDVAVVADVVVVVIVVVVAAVVVVVSRVVLKYTILNTQSQHIYNKIKATKNLTYAIVSHLKLSTLFPGPLVEIVYNQ